MTIFKNNTTNIMNGYVYVEKISYHRGSFSNDPSYDNIHKYYHPIYF